MNHEHNNPLRKPARQIVLIQVNVALLRQALAMVDSIDHQAFALSPAHMEPHTVGNHLRHILEFYECFLSGLVDGRIDYDSRRRDNLVATCRATASTRILTIIEHLESNSCLHLEAELLVRAEDADALQLADPFLPSSIGRELLTLSSHTIHHFALIAMTLRTHGIEIDPGFGMAPSTLTYQKKVRSAKLLTEAA